MDEITAPYTQEELASKTIQAYYRVCALEIAMTGVLSGLLSSLSQLESPITPEQAKSASSDLKNLIEEIVQQHFQELLVGDRRILEVLRKKISDELDLPE